MEGVGRLAGDVEVHVLTTLSHLSDLLCTLTLKDSAGGLNGLGNDRQRMPAFQHVRHCTSDASVEACDHVHSESSSTSPRPASKSLCYARTANGLQSLRTASEPEVYNCCARPASVRPINLQHLAPAPPQHFEDYFGLSLGQTACTTVPPAEIDDPQNNCTISALADSEVDDYVYANEPTRGFGPMLLDAPYDIQDTRLEDLLALLMQKPETRKQPERM